MERNSKTGPRESMTAPRDSETRFRKERFRKLRRFRRLRFRKHGDLGNYLIQETSYARLRKPLDSGNHADKVHVRVLSETYAVLESV